ncbi:YbhB/YbcL family Raf kinase inhibitor-like protein [Flavobacterium sp. J27]|uniref:YbhB/YbcL family Raf kinase inhibitor-like protein n=1 Tax=Flavobacterium sp. J27 TaxID=2060419 RepID=UPI0010322350|nr:YbhB/YbcL family Raf kinase inhibitor-like protein [Flavobacterium sp. J27]
MKKLILALFLFVSSLTQAQTFTLKSNDIGGQSTKKQEFNGFGCSGDNVSPQLFWENAPKGTKSYAITMYDPDAPTGSGFWHWVVFDIPTNTKELVSNAGNPSLNLVPKGTIQSKTSYGANGYGGPCPPEGHGIHTYIITIHALKIDKLGLDQNTNPEIVGYYLWQNTIEKASIVMYYSR